MKQKSPSWLLKNTKWKLTLCFLFGLISLFCFSSKKHTKLFQLVTSEYAGITIKNKTVESKSLNAIDTKNIYKSGSTGVGQEISWLPEGESSFPMTSAINNLISKLHGKMRTMVCQYKDSKLLQKN